MTDSPEEPTSPDSWQQWALDADEVFCDLSIYKNYALVLRERLVTLLAAEEEALPTPLRTGRRGAMKGPSIPGHSITYTGGRSAVNENQAVCSCGWKGESSHLGSKVKAEAETHLAAEDEQPATADAHLLATLDEIDNMDGPPWQYDHISEVQSIWFDKGVSAAVEAMRAALVDRPAAPVDEHPPAWKPEMSITEAYGRGLQDGRAGK